jgi:hypothetical protein
MDFCNDVRNYENHLSGELPDLQNAPFQQCACLILTRSKIYFQIADHALFV